MSMLKFEHIDKIYPNNVQAVFDFNLEVEEGEFIVFVGPSGCGKSTILRMIAGLEEISNGEMKLADKVINKLAPKDRDISFVFQNYALYSNLTVYDNVGMSMKVRHEDPVTIHDVVMPTSESLGLGKFLNRFPDQLSGGQKQRVALGRAITREPKVFLMDEPLSNLDAKLRNETRIEIMKLQRKLGVTTIYVTHDQVEAMTMGDRMVLLKDGRVQQIDTPYNVYTKPANMFAASFVGTPQINFLHGEIVGTNFVSGDLTMSLNAEQQALLAGRTKVVMGLRPEGVFAADDDHPAMLSLPVYSSEFYGDCEIVHLEMGEGRISAKFSADVDVKRPLIPIWLNGEIAMFFDPETEVAIR